MAKIFTKISILILFFLASCVPDAPRDNPLDSRGTTWEDFIVSGNVYTYYAPNQPLSNALLTIQPQGISVISESDGSFRFNLSQGGDYKIVIEKEGYQCDSALVMLRNDQRSANIDWYLNGLPEPAHVLMRSEFIDQWWPGAETNLIVDIRVSDPDGASDIDSVFLVVPEFNIRVKFRTTAEADSFAVSLQETELPDNNMQNIIGIPVFTEISDKAGATCTFGPYYLHRIISETPFPNSPTGLAVVTAPVTFIWDRTEVNFGHVQVLSLYQVFPVGSVLIDQVQNISPEAEQYLYQQSLQPGTYFWTIGIRDSLYNTCRSKEASFIIE